MPHNVLDWLFLLTALTYEVLIAGVLLSDRMGRPGLRDRLGRIWLWLALPLVIIGAGYALTGRGREMLPWLILPLLYILVEWLLDVRLKFPFRDRWITHAPYILLEYAALFSLIRAGSRIGRFSLWALYGGLWLVIGAVAATYIGRGRRGR